jgi:hypothetical protein
VNGFDWELDAVRKAADDQLWFQRLSDLALVDKVTYTGPPNPGARRPTASRTSAIH